MIALLHCTYGDFKTLTRNKIHRHITLTSPALPHSRRRISTATSSKGLHTGNSLISFAPASALSALRSVLQTAQPLAQQRA